MSERFGELKAQIARNQVEENARRAKVEAWNKTKHEDYEFLKKSPVTELLKEAGNLIKQDPKVSKLKLTLMQPLGEEPEEMSVRLAWGDPWTNNLVKLSRGERTPNGGIILSSREGDVTIDQTTSEREMVKAVERAIATPTVEKDNGKKKGGVWVEEHKKARVDLIEELRYGYR